MFITRLYRIVTNLGATPRTAYKLAKLKPDHLPTNAAEALALLALKGYRYQPNTFALAPELKAWKFWGRRSLTTVEAKEDARWGVACFLAAYFEGDQADAIFRELFGVEALANVKKKVRQKKAASPGIRPITVFTVAYEDRLKEIIETQPKHNADHQVAESVLKARQRLTAARARVTEEPSKSR